MHWIFYTFFVKFVVETFFFNEAYFSEVLWLVQWVSFSGNDYYVLLLVLLVFNKFTEINTLTKRNLNFKCDVKSHKVIIKHYLFCLNTKLMLNIILIAEAKYWLTNVILRKKITRYLKSLIIWYLLTRYRGIYN